MDNSLVITVRDMADRLKISMPTAYSLTERPGFPVIRIGRKKLVLVSELERWISEQALKGA